MIMGCLDFKQRYKCLFKKTELFADNGSGFFVFLIGYNGLGYDFGVEQVGDFSAVEISLFKVSISFSLFIRQADTSEANWR